MEYTATGTIKSISDTNQVSDKFKKREFVLSIIENNFEELVKFELKQDKCDLLNNSRPGDKLKVWFNLRGREWTRPSDGLVMYFNTLEPWKIEQVRDEVPAPIAPIDYNTTTGSDPALLQPEAGTGLPF